MSKGHIREETGELCRCSPSGLFLRTDAGHFWFLDIEERRAEFLIGLRVRIKGLKAGRSIRVRSIVLAGN
jgi:hypothetical protein